MNRITLASLLAGASLLAAGSLRAQQVSVTLTADGNPSGSDYTAFGYYMSPYTGTVGTSNSPVRLNCVDFFHEVTNGETWTANEVNLGAAINDPGLLSVTRNGAIYTGGTTLFVDNQHLDALGIYKAAAWLTTQYPSNPSTDLNESKAIQTAIWYLTSEYDPTHPTTDPSHEFQDATYNSEHDYWDGTAQSTQLISTYVPVVDGVNSTGYWVDKAVESLSTHDASYYNQFTILSDINATGPTSAQEYIYSTPEPGTFVLIGTGLFMVLGLTIRARRQDGADAGFGSTRILA